ncbi:PREDICTED: pentatricopeptide repeat-containing protein At1g03560, mitochondrial-like [Nelumbo nucifera]|uniref:Pentatricopeptide repeat-containing protein At1g03560, mitochondrial-like n=1 Tax=Nelumbo nucifera TaxID=4432 RepID=A0A1U7YTQ0_NELNU|nr:PREDICTED: pentatricopeptide repeat-containing protein At1g03560, mitochondrial-like [Nelumbo nucifera]
MQSLRKTPCLEFPPEMFLCHSVRHSRLRTPATLSISASLSLLSSQTETTNPNNPPPRKGRQAVRRLLKLLSTASQQNQNPHLCEILKSLQCSPVTISTSQASTLISSISNPLISFDFYRFLRSLKPVFQPDSILFSSLIKSQLQSVNPHLPKILFYFGEMKKHKVSLSHDDFCCLFCLVVPGYVDIADFFVRELLEKAEFDECAYNYAMSIYAKHGLYKEAILVAERARARSRELTLEFYSCTMDVYGKKEDAGSAMKLFLEMEERGILADERVYRNLLGVLCKAGWVKLCWVILEEMRKVGCRPDERLAMDLLRRFLKEGMVLEAGCFFKEGILKDMKSLAVYAEAMEETKRPWTAFQLVQDLCKSGLDVSGCVYASLIRGCGKIGLIYVAEKIFAGVKSSTSVENRESVYTSMIYVYSRAQMKKSAEIFWNEMESTVGFGGNAEPFLYMMSMYGELGLIEDVLRMFDRWKNSGCCVNIDAYAVLIDALSKSGKLNQARSYLLEMRRSKIHPSSSIYAYIMDGYLQVGLLNHAITMLDEYTMLGLEADELIASSIIKTLIQVGRLSELEFHLDKFMRQGIKISSGKGAILVEMCKDDSCLRKLSELIQ